MEIIINNYLFINVYLDNIKWGYILNLKNVVMAILIISLLIVPIINLEISADSNNGFSNMYPSNEVQDIAIDVTLSWNYDNKNVTFDVFFGECDDPPPPRIARRQNESYYALDQLSYNTTYCWFVVAYLPSGTIDTSHRNSFTTKKDPNSEPHNPSNPVPNVESSNVPIDATLQWNGGDPDIGDSVTYDVYFGYDFPLKKIDAIGPFSSTKNQLTYELNNLYNNVTYYWRIESYDNHPQHSKVIGDNWSFTTIQNEESLSVSIETTETNCNTYDFFAETVGGQAPYNWSWKLNDEIIGYGQQIAWIFESEGNHIISLEVSDFKSKKKTNETTISIMPIDISLSAPAFVKLNDVVSFSATVTNGCEPYEYNWDFDDGSISTDKDPDHSYESYGSYNVKLTVTDKHGLSNTSSIQIFISNDKPNDIIILSRPLQLKPDEQGSFSFKVTDSNNDDIRLGLDWDEDQIVDDWTVYHSSGSTVEISHTWENEGEFNISVIAEDSYGGESNWSTFSINIRDVNCLPPKNPNPKDTANAVSRATTLSWNWDGDSESVTFNVFIKKISETSFKKIASDIDRKQVNPDLVKNTDYEWYVEANCENDGTRASEIWRFSTKKLEDISIVNPYPANGQNNVNINTDLSWQVVPSELEGITFDVYFAKYNEDLFKELSNHSSLTYSGLDELEYGNRYKWKIIVYDEEIEVNTSLLWSFRTTKKEGGEGDGHQCQAVIQAPSETDAGKSIDFDASGSYTDECDIESYTWDFGDGSKGNGKRISHSFVKSGSYRVKLTIDCGMCGIDSAFISVDVSSRGPRNIQVEDSFLPLFPGRVGVEYEFRLTAEDPDGDDIRFHISWGDNSSDTITDYVESGGELVVTHIWEDEGDFNVTVNAEDIHGTLADEKDIVEMNYPIRFTLSIALYAIIAVGSIITLLEVLFVIIANKKGITT